MNCHAAEELIQRSLDAPVSPAERVRLETHLADCPTCRQAQDQYLRLSQAAEDWASRPISTGLSPDEFTAQVMARLAAHPAPRPVWPRLLAGGLAFSLAAALSPVVAPLLPAPTIVRPTWSSPSVALWLLEQLHSLPQQALGWWTMASQSLMTLRWAALLLAVALPLNALLCLFVRRDARRMA